MKNFILLIILIFFTACGTPEIPKWYINTPKDNTLYFYASAEGYSKQNAVQNALNDIASRINVKISSNFVINRGIHNKKTYNEIYQQINTRIENVSFNNYEILKTEKQGDKFYVLVKVDKQKLIQSLKTKIKLKLKNLNINGTNAIKKVISAYKTLNTLKKIKSDVFILESLGVDISPYILKIEKMQSLAQSVITNTIFSLKANRFKDITIEVLSRYILIAPNSENVISLHVSTKKLMLFNSYIIKGKAEIFIDKPYTLTFLGKSISSYKDALSFAKNEYKNRLKNLCNKIFNSF